MAKKVFSKEFFDYFVEKTFVGENFAKIAF